MNKIQYTIECFIGRYWWTNIVVSAQMRATFFLYMFWSAGVRTS